MKTCLKIASALVLSLSPISAFAENAAPAPVDAERLAAARAIVGHVFPAGTYARIMNGTMDGMMKGMLDGFGKMPMRDLATIGGLSEAKLAQIGDVSLNEVTTILDPAFHQRMDLAMHTMMREMGTMMSSFEPAMQDGLTEAYARRFTAPQLGELNQFFNTPTGNTYASESMMLFMDPAVMAKMQAFVPELMKQMPAIISKVSAATASLPKPRKPADLSPAERRRLAQLLGTTEQQLLRGK
jgi:Uncharacterized protein conserved in bacteria (DUF2059)